MESPLRSRLGYGLFAFYLVIAFLLRNHQTFMDEGSNLNLGFCVLRGMHLYRDVFENHFPLPVYISAAIQMVAGTSLPLVRLAVLVIDAAMLMAAMRVSRLPFAIGLAAAVWSLISPYYYGNLLLYDNLAMIGGMALGAVCFAALARSLPASRGMFALLTIAGILTTMSNPFFALVTAVAIGSLLFAPQIPRAFVVKLAAAIATPIVCYFAYLTVTGALGSFYFYAVTFNTTIYPKYAPLNIGALIAKQLFLLDIFNPAWIRSMDPLRFDPFTISPVFDHWIFSGLFYRLAALSTCLWFALRRNYRTALFLYLFSAMLPLRGDVQFHAAPFVLFSLFLTAILIEESPSLPVHALCGACILVLSVSGARYVVKHALESNFEPLMTEAQQIKEAARGQANVQLGHYPDGNYMYYLTGLVPLSKFVDFYPWVAEIGKPAVDFQLANASKVILSMDVAGEVWQHPNYETFSSEIAYARTRLVKEKFGQRIFYVSPSLAIDNHRVTGFTSEKASKPGLYRDGEWRLPDDVDNLQSPQTKTLRFGGKPGDIPVTGDWDGSGTTKIGIYRPSTGEWLLESNGKSYQITPHPDDIPVTGDWNGSGKTKIGIYRPSTGEWLLDYNGAGSYSKRYQYGGAAGDRPVTGDWNGSGTTKLGIVHKNYCWMLNVKGDGVMNQKSDVTFCFGGIPGDIPVTGDWNGDGRSKPGLFRQSYSWLFDTDGNYQFDISKGDIYLFYGAAGDIPVVGAW